MLRSQIVLAIAEHLNGAVIDRTATLETDRSTLHFWGYSSPEGERTLVIQQVGRAFTRWRVFEGPLEAAQQHCRQRLPQHAPAPAAVLPVAA